MEALRDPFSKVHPFFWPVLWLSLRAFVRWTRRMIEDGHAYGGLYVEITWYGWIHVHAIDLSETGKDFRRHMHGSPREDGWGVLAEASVRVEALLKVGCIEGAARYAPAVFAETMDGAYRFARCTLRRPHSQNGTGPPEVTASLPHAGRGAQPSLPTTPTPRPARALVLETSGPDRQPAVR